MGVQIRFTRNGQPVGDKVDCGGVKPPYNDIHIAFAKGGGEVKVEYTKDGKVIRERKAPAEATGIGSDFEIESDNLKIWRIYWTDKDGKRIAPVPPDKDEEPGINDMHLILPPNGKITAAVWTHDGEVLKEKSEVYPKIGNLDANDFHFGESAHFPWEAVSLGPSRPLLRDMAQRLAFVQGQLNALMLTAERG